MLALVVKLDPGSFAGRVAVRVARGAATSVFRCMDACSPDELAWKRIPEKPLGRPPPLEVSTRAWRLGYTM